MKSFLVLAATVAVILSGGRSEASLVLTNYDPNVIGFSSFTAPVAGWSNSGGTDGALDWNTWAFSTGTRTEVAGVFGESNGTGRGTSNGSVADNGIYAFNLGGGLVGWGFQATGGFGSPGSLTLRVNNNTGSVLNELSVDYTAWYLNNAPRSGTLRPYYSLTNNGTADSYVQADGSAQDINSAAAADANPIWVANNRGYTLTNLNLADGANIYLRWGFNDSGSSTRDEWAISSITVTAVPEPSALLLVGSVLGVSFLRRRRA